LRWTVAGLAPTPARPEPCSPIHELEIRFHDPGGWPEEYRPVPCSLGQAVYDKMPPRFHSVELRAYDRGGDLLDAAEEPLAPSGETALLIDLAPSRRPGAAGAGPPRGTPDSVRLCCSAHGRKFDP
jgi:hypothetical protein